MTEFPKEVTLKFTTQCWNIDDVPTPILRCKMIGDGNLIMDGTTSDAYAFLMMEGYKPALGRNGVWVRD